MSTREARLDVKKELFKWYDKDHLWRWQEVLDFVLHILALKNGGKNERRN